MAKAPKKTKRSKTIHAGDEPRVGWRPTGKKLGHERRGIRTSRPKLEAWFDAVVSDRPAGDALLGPTRSAAMLIGATVALTTAGLIIRFADLFDRIGTPHPSLTSSVVGSVLITISLGVRMPQRIAVWVCANAWRRVVSHEQPATMDDIVQRNAVTDRPLYWTVLSVVALATGLLVAMLPLNLRVAAAIYAWTQSHFLWPLGPLALLQAATVFLAGVLPLALLGIAVSCIHHLSCQYGRWRTSATAWLLIGAAGGTFICAWLSRSTTRADLLLVAGALPSLLLSVVAAMFASRQETQRDHQAESEASPAPISSVRRPRLVRIGIVCAACTASCVMGVALSGTRGAIEDRMVYATILLLVAGIGAMTGCRLDRKGTHSIETFGITSLAAGAAAILATTCLALSASVPESLCVTTVFIATATVSFAMTYGPKALIQRVASRSNTGAIILARMLTYAGLTVWIYIPTAERIGGPHTPPLALAVVLVVVGAILSVPERTTDPRTSP